MIYPHEEYIEPERQLPACFNRAEYADFVGGINQTIEELTQSVANFQHGHIAADPGGLGYTDVILQAIRLTALEHFMKALDSAPFANDTIITREELWQVFEDSFAASLSAMRTDETNKAYQLIAISKAYFPNSNREQLIDAIEHEASDCFGSWIAYDYNERHATNTISKT